MSVRALQKTFASEKRYGEPVVAVRGLYLAVYEGNITCLLGPNGAGKSKFLSMLMGLMRSDKGTIHVFQLVGFVFIKLVIDHM